MDNLNWENIFTDEVSYHKFYADYYKKFYNYGKKFTFSINLIEDSIQEVFLAIWTNREKLLHVRSVDSYLFSSFRYILLRRIRTEKKFVNSGDLELEPSFSIEYALVNQEISDELQLKLRRALKSLTPRQREAIFLRFYQNLSYEDMAEVLDISVKATYKIMARSLSTLKNSMIVSGTVAFPISFLIFF